MTSKTYQISPWGVAQYPWLTKADTKFDDGGVFKFDLVLGGADAIKFKEEVDSEAAKALERYFETDEGKKVAPKLRKEWKAYSPLKVDTDDQEGDPTGYVVFKFKQKQTLRLKDGTTKLVKIGVKDASGKKEVTKPVFGGSELRAMFTFRDIVMKADKQVGVQLAFAQVQVRKLAEPQGQGFEEAEGYHDEGHEDQSAPDQNQAPGGDY